ncbi:MAG: hypothetical protein KatS3mg082_0904 [Nitrospiraceae bacterium]|nr:MAG: hypothetical protein KatS3mg082_0904 [Nitrospiraceae bacterium]
MDCPWWRLNPFFIRSRFGPPPLQTAMFSSTCRDPCARFLGVVLELNLHAAPSPPFPPTGLWCYRPRRLPLGHPPGAACRTSQLLSRGPLPRHPSAPVRRHWRPEPVSQPLCLGCRSLVTVASSHRPSGSSATRCESSHRQSASSGKRPGTAAGDNRCAFSSSTVFTRGRSPVKILTFIAFLVRQPD